MREVDLPKLADAVVAGARKHGQLSGHTYSRRQLTAKQRSLLSLLADGDGVGFSELAAAFPGEWDAIKRSHPGKRDRDNQRAFFQNIAEIGDRINAYLQAGYKDAAVRKTMVESLGGRFVGVGLSFEEREVFLFDAPDYETFNQTLQTFAPAPPTGGHGRRRARRALPPRSNAPSSPPQPATVQAPALATQKDIETPASAEALPEVVISSPPVEPDVVWAAVNPVTGRWTLDLPGRRIEADSRLDLVLVNGLLVRWPGPPLPADPEQLTPDQLALLRTLS